MSRAYEDLIVYEPPEPHECIAEGWFQPDMREGSIIQCDCGRYWWRRMDYSVNELHWVPVRWWHFMIRKQIRLAA